MERDELMKAHVARVKEKLAEEIPSLFDFNSNTRKTPATNKISALANSLNVKELLWHYRLFCHLVERPVAAFPKKELAEIMRALKKLLNSNWLKTESEILEIKSFIVRRMGGSDQGPDLFVRQKRGAKNFPRDFLVGILFLHIKNKRGKYPLIGDFLCEQKVMPVADYDVVQKICHRIQLKRLWSLYQVKMAEGWYMVNNWLQGVRELTPNDITTIYNETVKPFEYFLPAETRRTLGITS